MCRLLLATAVVVGAISPPGYRHVHAGGSVGHDHRSESPIAVSHDNHGHAQPHQHGGVSETHVVHSHFAILWIDVSLPAPDDGDSEPSEPESGELPSLVRVINECVPMTDSIHLGLGAPADLQTIVCADFGLAGRTTELSVRSANRVFLCDAARHERSGVHRI